MVRSSPMSSSCQRERGTACRAAAGTSPTNSARVTVHPPPRALVATVSYSSAMESADRSIRLQLTWAAEPRGRPRLLTDGPRTEVATARATATTASGSSLPVGPAIHTL